MMIITYDLKQWTEYFGTASFVLLWKGWISGYRRGGGAGRELSVPVADEVHWAVHCWLRDASESSLVCLSNDGYLVLSSPALCPGDYNHVYFPLCLFCPERRDASLSALQMPAMVRSAICVGAWHYSAQIGQYRQRGLYYGGGQRSPAQAHTFAAYTPHRDPQKRPLECPERIRPCLNSRPRGLAELAHLNGPADLECLIRPKSESIITLLLSRYCSTSFCLPFRNSPTSVSPFCSHNKSQNWSTVSNTRSSLSSNIDR